MNTQGIGLGLVVSDNIINCFDGKIGVKSRYGHGSKFAFCILLDDPEDWNNWINFTKFKSLHIC